MGCFNVAGSGIPGVGVAPGEGETLAFAGSGIPGVDSADGGIGLADISGGRLFASMLVTTLEFCGNGSAYLFELLTAVDDPHPAEAAAAADRRISFLII
jgi:hypothetical protein